MEDQAPALASEPAAPLLTPCRCRLQRIRGRPGDRPAPTLRTQAPTPPQMSALCPLRDARQRSKRVLTGVHRDCFQQSLSSRSGSSSYPHRRPAPRASPSLCRPQIRQLDLRPPRFPRVCVFLSSLGPCCPRGSNSHSHSHRWPRPLLLVLVLVLVLASPLRPPSLPRLHPRVDCGLFPHSSSCRSPNFRTPSPHYHWHRKSAVRAL
jgi:hypothetical protein